MTEKYDDRESQLRHYYKRKHKFVALLGGKCARCPATEGLEFDHKDPGTKTFTIGNFMRRDEQTVLKELEKCQLLCRPCHEDKTREEGSLGRGWTNQPRLVHGSAWTYKHHKCRCEVCVVAHGPSREVARKEDPIPHGTRRGYLREVRRGITPCADCRKANSDYARNK